MATSFEDFMTPKSSQWIFMKPDPPKEFANHTTAISKDKDTILCIAFAILVDDTNNRFLQGVCSNCQTARRENATRSIR